MNEARTKLQAEFSELSKQVAEVMADRGKNYGGDPFPGFRTIGLLWQGLLEDHFQIQLPPITPAVVASMMAAMKISRSCRPGYDFDNTLDAVAYLHLADHCSKREDAA